MYMKYLDKLINIDNILRSLKLGGKSLDLALYDSILFNQLSLFI